MARYILFGFVICYMLHLMTTLGFQASVAFIPSDVLCSTQVDIEVDSEGCLTGPLFDDASWKVTLWKTHEFLELAATAHNITCMQIISINITAISSNAFQNLHQMQRLQISGTPLQVLADGLLSSAFCLTHLILTCKYYFLDQPDVFKGITLYREHTGNSFVWKT